MSALSLSSAHQGFTALPMNVTIAWRGPGGRTVVYGEGSGAAVAPAPAASASSGSGFAVDVSA